MGHQQSIPATNLSQLAGTAAPRLVVSDVDGTLINHAERVSDRMRAVVTAMQTKGAMFTLATGRPARWLLPILEQLPVRPTCVCANGAVVYDSATDTIIQSATLDSSVLHQLVDTIREHLQGAGFGVERVGQSAYDRIDELFAVCPDFHHVWPSDEHATQPLDELLAKPVVKLLVRHPTMSSQAMFEQLNPHIDPDLAALTYSWPGGLLELAAPGVSKRSALQGLADSWGIHQRDIIAFGDMPNDIEMLTWAGRGVAMGNAPREVQAIANLVAPSNEADGVAAVLSTWFGDRP